VVLSPDGGASGLSPGAVSQKLVRRELSSEETFDRLVRHFTTGSRMVEPSDWTALERLEADTVRVGINSVIAQDVIRFDVRRMTDAHELPNNARQWTDLEVPSWVEVTLRVTNRQTGQWLTSLADWTGRGQRAKELLNDTPDIYHDDPEVRTYSLRARLPIISL
jgi:hypothetical protein